MREHLALASAQLAGLPPQHAAELREQLQDVFESRSADLGGAQQVAAHLEVFADGERCEDVVDLRHVPDADARDVLRRPSG